MQTKDPKMAYLVTIYGTTVEALTENPWKDCESWARYDNVASWRGS